VPGSPLISVIIPVYQVRDYLAECLDSILGQQGTDIEVIAVDGGSADGSGDILDARAGQDGRLRVLHLDHIGPGPARNEGLRQATGQYVWFADGDDVLAPGSLEAVAERLRRDAPDLLLIDYEYLFPDGSTGSSPGASLLREVPAGGLTLAQRPGLLSLAMTVWSKIIRREFLLGLQLPFPDGIHEDVPVSCAALLGAGQISVQSRVCYRYRQARRGSFMIQSTEAHFDIFRSYREVFDLMAKRRADGDPAITGPVAAALFERAIWHYTTILGHGGWGIGRIGSSGLVPRRLHHRFFTTMHEDFLKHRPEGYRPPGGARGAKFRLIERNAYWTYSALEPVNRLRVRLARALRPGRPGRPPGSEKARPG
jgi:CDP-glycerol glycerophosphotransferase